VKLHEATRRDELTNQAMYVELERCVVALFGVVQMDEEEDVRPDVMLVVDVVIEPLPDTHRHTKTVANCRHQ